MLESALAKILGYGVFWSSDTRQRFRTGVRARIRNLKKFIFCSSLKTVPRSQGERLVERRVSILGLPVSSGRHQRPKYRVALLVDEFFGGWDTAIGGYGALARKYICKFVPNDGIEIDLLLDTHGGAEAQQKLVDQTMLCRLPEDRKTRQEWLDQQAYNLFLSIEMTHPSFKILSEYESDTPLLYWVQDPRDLKMYQSRLQTVNRLKDDDWAYIKDV